MGLLNVMAKLRVKDEKLFKERSLMLAPRSCSKSCVIATSIVEGELEKDGHTISYYRSLGTSSVYAYNVDLVVEVTLHLALNIFHKMIASIGFNVFFFFLFFSYKKSNKIQQIISKISQIYA